LYAIASLNVPYPIFPGTENALRYQNFVLSIKLYQHKRTVSVNTKHAV
jgi:hypothetical protein